MILLLYIFLGILLFDCLLVCCRYFRKERPIAKYGEYLNYLKTVKSN